MKKELEQEQNSCDVTTKMLNNIQNSQDSEQINRLKDIIAKHQKNIAALNKEISASSLMNINLDMVKSVDGPKPPQSLPSAIQSSQKQVQSTTPALNQPQKSITPTVSQQISKPSVSTQKLAPTSASITNAKPVTNPQTKVNTHIQQKLIAKPETTIQPQKPVEVKKEISPADFLMGK